MISFIRRNKNVLFLTFLAILIFTIVFCLTFDGLWITDSFYYGTISRNIFLGNGFSHNCLLPDTSINDQTEYTTATNIVPLHPLFISGLFHIFSASDRVVGLSSGIFFILTIPFLFLLAKSLFGSTVAIISSLIYIFDTHLLFTYSICGLTEPMFMFFLIIFFYVLYKSVNYKHFLLAGTVIGLANLTRLDPFFYILPVAVYLFLSTKNDRIKNMATFLFGYILVMSPYFIFCHLKFGNPFIIFSRGYEMLPAAKYTSLVDSTSSNNLYGLISILAGSFLGILKKMYVHLSGYYHRFFQIANPYLLAFFVVSIFKTYKNKNLRNFSILFLVLFTIQILVSSAAVPTPKSFGQFRHLIIFYPVMIIFASSLIVSIFENISRTSKLRYAFLCLLFLLIFIPTITNFYHAFRSNLKTSHHHFREIGELITANTSPDEIIATNIPYPLSWYADCKVMDIFMSKERMREIDGEVVPINAILVTDLITYYLKLFNNPILNEDWKDIFITKKIEGYLLVEEFQGGEVKALLFKKSHNSY